MTEQKFKNELIAHLVDAHNRFADGLENNGDRHEVRELAAASNALADLFVDLYGVDELDEIAQNFLLITTNNCGNPPAIPGGKYVKF